MQENIVNGNGYLLEPQITVPENLTNLTVGTDGAVTQKILQQDDVTNFRTNYTCRFYNLRFNASWRIIIWS